MIQCVSGTHEQVRAANCNPGLFLEGVETGIGRCDLFARWFADDGKPQLAYVWALRGNESPILLHQVSDEVGKALLEQAQEALDFEAAEREDDAP